MNILFFNNNEILPEAGGISRVTKNLGDLFASKGHIVYFLAAKRDYVDSLLIQNQFILPDKIIDTVPNHQFLQQLIRDFRIDIIINQSALCIGHVNFLYEFHKDVHIVSCIHTSIITPVLYYAYQKEYLLKKKHLSFLFHLLSTDIITKLAVRYCIAKRRELYLNTLRRSEAVYVLCDGLKEEMKIMCGNNPLCDKVDAIPNFTEGSTYTKLDKENIVLWVGTFDYAIKRPDYMIKIWKNVCAKHPNWKLLMLGSGSSLGEMKTLANKFNVLNIEFTGRVNPNEYYRKAKILCSTSIHEAFPMVILEAQCNGVVPMAFDSFKSGRVIIDNDENGQLIEPFNLEYYASALDCLMGSESEVKRMSENAKAKSDMFDANAVYAIWKEKLNNVGVCI